MKKTHLQSIRNHNRQLLLNALLESERLSRIELAQYTGLSPSTVTTLTADLLEEGLLSEAGAAASTGGRRRIELTLNAAYGDIAVVEIGRDSVELILFDMCMNKVGETTLSKRFISGNELMLAISGAIAALRGPGAPHSGRLAGIGLLFQEDMSASDFCVMYSTGLSSDLISLREALYTHLRVPVYEEYSIRYCLSDALESASERRAARSSAHISLAKSVHATVTVDGVGLPVKLEDNEALAPFLESFGAKPREKEKRGRAEQGSPSSLANRVAGLIALLSAMFSLDAVYLSGDIARQKSFMANVGSILNGIAPAVPPIRTLCSTQREAGRFAQDLRYKILIPEEDV